MKRFVTRTTVALALGLGLILILLLGLPAAKAAPTATTRYVAPWGDDSGNTCTSPITPCRTVQQAVNLSWSGDDEVLVAEGVYTATSGQVLFINATVVIRGGYSADFSAWDPQAHPTTLDGRGSMRVVYMLGDITPHVGRTAADQRLRQREWRRHLLRECPSRYQRLPHL